MSYLVHCVIFFNIHYEYAIVLNPEKIYVLILKSKVISLNAYYIIFCMINIWPYIFRTCKIVLLVIFLVSYN